MGENSIDQTILDLFNHCAQAVPLVLGDSNERIEHTQARSYSAAKLDWGSLCLPC